MSKWIGYCISVRCMVRVKTIEHLVETFPGIDSVRVELRYPVSDDALIEQFRVAVEGEKEGRIKVAIFDTVTSLPGARMPFERLVEECRNYGVLSLVDGAHGIGHLPLDLGRLGADFFVSNCHKYVIPYLSLSVAFHLCVRTAAQTHFVG
jgi:hercynylcysteine S-oxide lyase